MRYLQSPPSFGVVLVLLSLTATLSWGAVERPIAETMIHSIAAPEILTTAAPAQWEGCVGCDWCGEFPEEHEMYATGIRNVEPGSYHVGSCWSTGPCHEWHPVGCDSMTAATPDLNALWYEIVDGMRAEDVAAIVQRWPTVVLVNAERNALQVKGGCTGHIVAHIPLGDNQAHVLAQLID